MMADILDHRPARPETVIPGHWLIDLPPNATINIKRYRTPAQVASGSNVADDAIEAAWKAVNSYTQGPSHQTTVRSILGNGCGTVVAGPSGRQLWFFTSTTDVDANHLPDSSNLERVLPDLGPLDPSQVLSCPRHGHDRSCLSRPSTSQRPLKSCDVRFEPRGENKEIWEKLGYAIYERAEWAKGKRVMADQIKGADIELFPEPNGLLLRVRPTRKRLTTPARTPVPTPEDQMVTISPLGFRAINIVPCQATGADLAVLASSFELALGPGWKDGQAAHRLEAQLANKVYHDYTTLWVPDPNTSADDPPSPGSPENKNKKGILAVWPTHLISLSTTTRTKPRPPRPTPSISSDLNLDLLTSAASLFDAASTYREPMQEMTPPDDTSLEDDHGQPTKNEPVSPSAGSERGTASLQNANGNGDGEGDDDLEDLFASRPGSPGAFDTNGQFEMFGEADIRSGPLRNNAHMIDYDDVVMSSPQPVAALERRTSVREVMGEEDEAEIANVTEDDFNFFDSPPPDEKETPAVVVEEPAENVDEPLALPVEEVGHAEGHGRALEPDDLPGEAATETEPDSPPPEDTAEPSAPDVPQDLAAEENTMLDHQVPTAEQASADPTSIAPVTKAPTRQQDLVPDTFAPLVLAASQTVFKYSLPSPAPTPPNMNDALVARLKKEDNTTKPYDYSLAWRLGSPDSTADIEEYTGPPTPISEADDSESAPDLPVAKDQVRNTDRAEGQLEYDGLQCIAAGLASFVGQNQWAGPELVSWKSSWDTEPVRSAKDKEVLTSPLAPTSKKRKRVDESTWEAVDLEILAKQIIGNRAIRRFLIPDKVKISDRSSAEGIPNREGVPLAEMSSRDLGDQEAQGLPVAMPLVPCTIHTGYQGRVAQMSIAALRYWSELGLQPLSGPKDLKGIIINEHSRDERDVRRLAAELGQAYTALQLGTIDWITDTGEDGMINLDQIKGPIPQKDKPLAEHNVVTFVVSRSNPLSIAAKIRSRWKNHIIYCLPLSTGLRDMSTVARNVYDLIPRQLRVVHAKEDEQPPWYDYPSFTLAPAEPPKPRLTLQWPIKSFDVFGAWRWVHAAYAVDQITESVIVFVADTEGDNWVIRVIQDTGNDWSARIDAVWECVTGFAAAAAIEWRVSISSHGFMDPQEAKAWQDLYVARAEPVSIVVCDPATPSSAEGSKPRPIPPNVPPGIINDLSTSIIDESLSATYLTLSSRQPIPCGDETIYSDTSFLLSLSSSALQYDTSIYHVLYHRPPMGKEEEECDKELANELYRSACWARMMFGMEGVPAALAAVRDVNEGLSAMRRSQDGTVGHEG